MKELIIGKNDAGQRLDRFVAKCVPLLPESLLQKYVRIKRIKLNNKGAKRDTRLKEGDVLQLYINDEFFEKPREENSFLKVGAPRLDILYEDENILLVDKKPGVLCHSAGVWDHNTLIANIQAYLHQKGEWRPGEENSFAPALCNRIDRNTGGLVIAAKNAAALRTINEKIRLREIERHYLCVTLGCPEPPEGTISGFLARDEGRNLTSFSAQAEGAKQAVTHYKTLSRRGGLCLVECVLETGRTHQIRAQLSGMGTPILGDAKYGGRSAREHAQALYSYKLVFAFQSEAGPLEYLRGRVFRLDKIDFVEKYFSDFKF